MSSATVKGDLTISRWGNSLSVRIPRKVSNALGLANRDKLSYKVENNKIVLTPQKKESPLRKMFDGFDVDAYFKDEHGNKETDWGQPQGKEIF